MRKLTNQTRELVNLEGCQVISSRAYRRVLFERRLMAFCIACCIISVTLFIVSVATIKWARVTIIHNDNETTVLQLGIWGEYRTDSNFGKEEPAVWIRHFPDLPVDRPRLSNQYLPHYYRAQAVFSTIALGLMILSIFVGIYSLVHHRYMYKRLAAGLMLIVAMCVLVVVQVLVHSIDEWSSFSGTKNAADYVKDTVYDVSTVLAYIVFGVYACASIIFLFGGRKNKGYHAAAKELEVEDRPINLA